MLADPRTHQLRPQWSVLADGEADPGVTQLKSSAYEMSDLSFSYLNEDNRDMIRVNFVFKRTLTSSLIIVYIPTTLSVITSFQSFWIDVKNAEARITISMMNVLSIITLMFNVKQNFPEVRANIDR